MYEIYTAKCNDEDWQDEWKKYFHTVNITDNIVIKPSWDEYEPESNEIVIEIDPGLAFGTGTHETTSLCVEFLEKYVKGKEKLLDIGCGSGILMLIGKKLGIKKVVGIDIDEKIRDVVFENFSKNDINDDLLYMALDQMQQINIRMLLYPIRDYLKDPHKPSFAKTLIMEILIAQEIDEELEVEKNGHLYYFNPSISPLVLERECYNGVGRVLQRVLEDNNPSLLNQCLDFLEYYLYDTYPADIYEDEYIQTAGVIHYYVASLQNIEIDGIDLQIHYDMTLEEAERKSLALRIIE